MNQVLEEMIGILNGDEDAIMHYGMPRRSGRYPWGSGKDSYQRSRDILSRIEEYKKSGMTEHEIAEAMGVIDPQTKKPSINRLRAQISTANYVRRLYQTETIERLREKEGLGWTEIAKKMDLPESTVRSLMNEKAKVKLEEHMKTADFIKKQVDERGMIDVGKGVERELNISREKLNEALYILESEGYKLYGGGVAQINNAGQQTNLKVICSPGTEHREIYNLENVHSLKEYISRDGGMTYEKKFNYPESMDSKRLMIRYKEDGGVEKDGVVELRRGVADLDLGESRYAQVRILVDGTHYIKGMAVYGDDKDFPKGVDVIFNTNKGKDKSKMEVLKEIKQDPDNPFGSAIKDADKGGQYWYDSKTGKKWDPNNPVGEKKLGLINKRADEGDWTEWKDALPSQFLSKQSLSMAKKQLDIAKANKLEEYDEICKLTNPTVKKHLLEKFADECDSAAVNLQAAALPGQKYHVILPFPTMKESEIYAPNYPDGTKLALIRYPHGGTFEIPICTVNNKHPVASKLLGKDVTDAVGINSKVAERLSGADFDGDTVMCIPTHDRGGKVKIASKDPKSSPDLQKLEGFDPKSEYPERPGMKYMKDPITKKDATQMEMGKISNLITDMTLGGAPDDQIVRAVKHSMVVIDAGKHKLDYKRSEIENDIASLKREWQGKTSGGAGTLISRAKGQATVDKRQGSYKVNAKNKEWYDPTKPEGAKLWKTADDLYYPDRKYDKTTGTMTVRTSDGKKITYKLSDKDAYEKYNPVKKTDAKTGEVTYTNKAGDIQYKTLKRHQRSTKMAEVDDANVLVSEKRHPMEIVYAGYANSMKALGNKARLEMMATGKIEYSKEAKRKYQNEVNSLMSKLNTAELNTPRERAAQRMANAELIAKKESDPNMSKGDIKKKGQQALNKYRQEVGSVSRRDRNIPITDKEWEAIQAGAISETKLKRILNNTDTDALRQRATPRSTTQLSTAKINQIKALAASYTIAQIAQKFGLSSSTVSKYLKS